MITSKSPAPNNNATTTVPTLSALPKIQLHSNAPSTNITTSSTGFDQSHDDHLLTQNAQLENYANILLKKLEEKNAEIDFLNMQLQEKSSPDNPTNKWLAQEPSSDIIGLIKKTRKLNVQLEKERSTRSKYAAKVNELQSQLHSVQGSPQTTDIASIQDKHEKVKHALNTKISQLNGNLDQERAQSISLRAQVNRLKRVLAAEIGGDPSSKILTLVNESSGWKGRAQQILILRSKVKELQDQLDRRTPERKPACEHADTVNKKLRQRVLDEEKEIELGQLRDKTQHQQSVIDSLRARNHTLSQSCKTTKSMLRSVIDKASKDDTLIHALRSEIAHLKSVIMATASSSKTPTSQPLPSILDTKIDTDGTEPKIDSNISEISALRSMRKKHADQIRVQTERIAKLEIALQHELHKRAQWRPPPDAVPNMSKMPPSEREALMAENSALMGKINVLKDEVKVLQTSLDSAVIAKERELEMYCQALDDQRRGTVTANSVYSSTNASGRQPRLTRGDLRAGLSPIPHAMQV